MQFINYKKVIILSLYFALFNNHLYSNIEVESQEESFFNSNPLNEKCSYIYAPGMMGTEILMGRYSPKFIASTGEKICWKKGGHVIGEPHTAVIFSEIDLKKPNKFTLNPITATINKLRRDLYPFYKRFFQQKFEFTIEDNPKSNKSVANYTFDFSQANIGQKKDIKRLYKTYLKHIKDFPDTNVVLYGDSRGAATIFNCIALHKLTRVKAAVLDGIFDEVFHCIKHFIYDDKEENTENTLHDIVSFVMGSYKRSGITPIKTVNKIKDDIPLLFVTSLKDGLTVPQCAFNLYIKLKKRGHKKVHLLILEKSLHPCYMIDDQNDKQKYESTVHAFYKFYGLPHNNQKALDGQKYFEQTQPVIEELDKYNLTKCSLCL